MSIRHHGLSEEDRRDCCEVCLSLYLDGQCYAFAIALHRNLGWQIVGLMDGEVIRHAAVLSPGGVLFDIRGEVPLEKFGEPFGLQPPYQISPIEESDLFAAAPVSEGEIELAFVMIERIWPNLPGWKPSDFRKRAEAFMKGLDDLSREHGIYIRGPHMNPATFPVITDAFGGEDGYETRLPINSLKEMIFNRKLK